jgi:dihydrolipoamide dehydrogenase
LADRGRGVARRTPGRRRLAELLPELTLAQRWDLTVEELVRNVHTLPTLSEALQETFHGLAGKIINF